MVASGLGEEVNGDRTEIVKYLATIRAMKD